MKVSDLRAGSGFQSLANFVSDSKYSGGSLARRRERSISLLALTAGTVAGLPSRGMTTSEQKAK